MLGVILCLLLAALQNEFIGLWPADPAVFKYSLADISEVLMQMETRIVFQLTPANQGVRIPLYFKHMVVVVLKNTLQRQHVQTAFQKEKQKLEPW